MPQHAWRVRRSGRVSPELCTTSRVTSLGRIGMGGRRARGWRRVRARGCARFKPWRHAGGLCQRHNPPAGGGHDCSRRLCMPRSWCGDGTAKYWRRFGRAAQHMQCCAAPRHRRPSRAAIWGSTAGGATLRRLQLYAPCRRGALVVRACARTHVRTLMCARMPVHEHDHLFAAGRTHTSRTLSRGVRV